MAFPTGKRLPELHPSHSVGLLARCLYSIETWHDKLRAKLVISLRLVCVDAPLTGFLVLLSVNEVADDVDIFICRVILPAKDELLRSHTI